MEEVKKSGNVLPLRIASAARSVRHVFVRDLKLDAYIGVYEEEKAGKQPILINVDLTVSENTQALNDNIQNVVCYESIVRMIERTIDEGHVHLVETLAETIAQNCLLDDRVKVARIRVEKLEVIPAAKSVGVEIERARS